MKRFWTSDIHFGHANIVVHSKRPSLKKSDIIENDNGWEWVSSEACLAASERADSFNIKSINSRVKPGDIVIHNGDFLNYGNVKGNIGLRNKPNYYLNQLNGQWILIEGNHDANNGVKSIGRHLITSIGKLRVFVSHYPTDSDIQDSALMEYVYKCCDFAICGHVHNSWSEKWVKTYRNTQFLNINVGVDVRKYRPISDSEIYAIYEKSKRNQSKERI